MKVCIVVVVQFIALLIPTTLLLTILPDLSPAYLKNVFPTFSETCKQGLHTYSSSDISNSRQTGRILRQYAYQLRAPAWQCALLQTEGALWWRSVSRHQNVRQCAVGPEKKSPELCIISWVDNSMETLRPTGKTRRDPSQTWPLFSFHCQ